MSEALRELVAKWRTKVRLRPRRHSEWQAACQDGAACCHEECADELEAVLAANPPFEARSEQKAAQEKAMTHAPVTDKDRKLYLRLCGMLFVDEATCIETEDRGAQLLADILAEEAERVRRETRIADAEQYLEHDDTYNSLVCRKCIELAKLRALAAREGTKP